MGNAKQVDERDEILIEILETLQRDVQSIFELTSDVEGLKAALTPEYRKIFDAEKEKTRGQTAFALDRAKNSIHEAIARLRRT